MNSLKIGLIADTQYADRPMRYGRFFRNALRKTQLCMEHFKKENVNFCVHLGDIIDWPNQPEKGCEALDAILPVLNGLSVPMYYVLGNHDLASVPRDTMMQYLFPGSDRTWYSFDREDLHFVFLDCNYDAGGSPYRPDNSRWDHCYVPDSELVWLKNDLSDSGAKAVVLFVHALLDDLDNPHVIRNAEAVRNILENCGKPVTVFQGHMHCGHESVTNGIGYHTLRSIVEGRTRTCYWIVEVSSGEMNIDRYDSTVNRGAAKRETVLRFSEQT